MQTLRRALIPIAIWLCSVFVCSLTWAKPPMVEDFFRKPKITEPMMSPDGRHIVYAMNNEENDSAVVLLNLETMKSKSFMLGGKSTSPVMWLSNDRILLRPYGPGYTYYSISKDKSKAFNEQSWNLTVLEPRLDGSNLLTVWVSQNEYDSRQGPALINPDKIPPQRATRENERYNVVEWIPMPPGIPQRGISDWQNRILGALTYDEENQTFNYYYRANEGAPWTKLNIDGSEDYFAGFSNEPGKIYVIHQMDNDPTSGIYLYDTEKQNYVTKLFGDPDFSLSAASIDIDPKDGSLQGVYYINDGRAVHWFSAGMQSVQDRVNKKLPGRLNRIEDSDTEQKRFIISSTADTLPRRYYLYLKDEDKLSALPETHPWLNGFSFRPMQVIHYKTRDGLELQGYLTMPAANQSDIKPPLVVMPHPGPWERNIWGYEPDVQLLASRGYAVFQPNYRGSSGFTRAISKDDEFNFKAMLEDVTDGVQLLKKSGLINPDRMAIMGLGFGGYLALSGAAFEPDLYKCAVSIMGTFDWEGLVKYRGHNRFYPKNYDAVMKHLEHAEQRKEKFDSNSPLLHAKDIHIPIYISAGNKISGVNVSQTRKFSEELIQKGNTMVMFAPDVDGHNLWERNRNKMYAEIEAFLAKHL